MRNIKKIFCLCLAVAICLSFGGCMLLDEYKNSRVSHIDDEKIVLSDGTEYYKLPYSEEFSPDSLTNKDLVYVVDEETPLLLTDMFSDGYLYKLDDGLFLVETLHDPESAYYCRSDRYDEIAARINNGFNPDGYGYGYYDRDKEEFSHYMLSSKEADALTFILENITPEKLPDLASFDYDYMVDLMLCSSDLLFTRDTVDVCLMNDKYYIIDITEEEEIIIYTVPRDFYKTFESIMQKEVESQNYRYGD